MASTLPLSSTRRAVGEHAPAVVRSQAAVDGPTPSIASFAPFNGLRKGFSLSSTSAKGQVVVFRRTGRRFSNHRHTAVVAMAAGEASLPSLNDLPLLQYINQNGRILPPVDSSTQASVFVILDANKKVQYIGFSKDVRNSLRTLMGRRPEFCYYYKLYNLESVDQQKMLTLRSQWASELGSAPVGNTDPVQKKMWEQPSEAGSISERGKAAAAQSKAKTMLQMMVDRGLKEQMVYDPELLAQGLCDVITSEAQTAEEIEEAARTLAEEAARRHAVVVTSPAGEKVEFEIFFEQKFPTNGGWMYDILVSKDDKETRHRVICGRIYPEAVNMLEDTFVEIIMGFLLYKKVPRRTEGLLAADQFPINYFAVSQVAQVYDDLKDWFQGLGTLPDNYWRFNKIHDYGPVNSPPLALGPGAGSGSSEDQPRFAW